MTSSYLQGHSPVASLSSGIFHTVVQQLTGVQLTHSMLRGPSDICVQCCMRVCAFCFRRIWFWFDFACDPVSRIVTYDAAHDDVIIPIHCTFAAISPGSGRQYVRPV